jgi:hypothetical protein
MSRWGVLQVALAEHPFVLVGQLQRAGGSLAGTLY